MTAELHAASVRVSIVAAGQPKAPARRYQTSLATYDELGDAPMPGRSTPGARHRTSLGTHRSEKLVYTAAGHRHDVLASRRREALRME